MLRTTYNSPAPDQQIRVLCVSNKLYWENREKPRNVSLPYLDLSGILEARKHCMSIVASSQLRTATRYMNDQIPAFLARVNLWVESGARPASEERWDAICRTLGTAESLLERVWRL
jgi:hypothetical protein